MKKLKMLAVALAAVAVTGSALAIPTIIVTDGILGATVSAATGIVSYSNTAFDSAWDIVITSGLTKPALGSATSPIEDIQIQATSTKVGPAGPLTVYLFDNGFGPTSGSYLAAITGHVITGSGATVTFNTYYNLNNSVPTLSGATVTGGTTSSLTTLTLPASIYNGSASASPGNLANPFSLVEVVSIGTGGLQTAYSLDASITGVPDGGTTIMLLGAALSGLAFLRRKLV